MTVPNRIREEARAAEDELRRLAAEAVTPPAPDAPPAPAQSLDTVPPGDVPHPNAIPEAPTPPAGGEAIDAAKYAELLQKFETLQGIHNKSSAQLAESTTRLDMLERLIAAQQVARAAEPAAPPAPAAPAALVTVEEVEEFGADLIDVVRRVAREEHGGKINTILNEIQKLNTRVASMAGTLQNTASVVEVDAETKFFEELDSLVTGADGKPDWQAINNSTTDDTPGSFLDWAKKVGDDSDVPRLAVLQRAYQRKDAKKCAAIFNGYKSYKGLPVGSDTPPAPPVEKNPAAALVSPSPVAPSTPTANRGSGKKVWTVAEIEKLSSDYTKGKWRGREDEYKQKTADIDLAFSEGRITP